MWRSRPGTEDLVATVSPRVEGSPWRWGHRRYSKHGRRVRAHVATCLQFENRFQRDVGIEVVRPEPLGVKELGLVFVA